MAGELARTEKEIQKAEDEIASIEEEFQKEEVATNSAKLNELTAVRMNFRSSWRISICAGRNCRNRRCSPSERQGGI